MKRFTMRRWRTNPGWMYQMLFIAWGSIWQIVDAPVNELENLEAVLSIGVPCANLSGTLVAILALHIDADRRSQAVERCAYPALIFSMSFYLWMALRFDGWVGLVNQPNFGVLLSEAVIAAAATRFVWLITGGRVGRWRHTFACSTSQLCRRLRGRR